MLFGWNRSSSGNGLQEEDNLERCLQHRLGSSLQREADIWPLVESRGQSAHQLPRNAGGMSGLSSLPTRPERTSHAGPLGQHDCGDLYKLPGGLSSRRLFILVEHLLVWAQLNLCLLRAAHVPGKLNQGADMLSRSKVPSEEWMLHLQTLQKIGEIFGKAEVNHFALKHNSHCPIYYSKDKDALAHGWPNHILYAFSPNILIPQVIRQIREQGNRVLMVALVSPEQFPCSLHPDQQSCRSWSFPRGRITSLRRTGWYDTPGHSCGPYIVGHSTGGYMPPSVFSKHHFWG